MQRPHGIDTQRPSSWKQCSNDRNTRQKSYRANITNRVKIAHPIQNLSQQL